MALRELGTLLLHGGFVSCESIYILITGKTKALPAISQLIFAQC